MDDKLKKKFILFLTIVGGIIAILVIVIVYQELVKVYGKIDGVGSKTLGTDEYMTSIENEIVKGEEILNSLKKYKSQRDKVNISYNFYISGPYDTNYTNSNWDIAISNFLNNMSRYSECLTKRYLVTLSQSSSNKEIILITFSCQE